MIERIGVDIVSVERIAKAMRREGFVERILTERERSRPLGPERVAGRWAAKEAVAKAVGTHLGWHEVEILWAEDGRPEAYLPEMHLDRTLYHLHISISHERHSAVGFAVLERAES